VRGAVNVPAWRTRWEVQGYDPERDESVPVVVGLVETGAGGMQVALRVGEDRVLILAQQEATGLADHLNATTTWWFSRLDHRLHLFRSPTNGLAETLCGRHASVAKLAEPSGEDQLRCVDCLRAFGELASGGEFR
jgi:hypothetical protein